MCFDGTKRLCHIRGKLRKRQWINAQDIILVGLRDYQDQKADVIMKYNSDEARSLKNLGHLPDSVNLELGMDPDDVVDFMEDSDDEEFYFPEQPYQPEISDSSEDDESDDDLAG